MQIYVGNLSPEVTDTELHELFAAHGRVTSVAIGTNQPSGQPAGYAIVVMAVKSEGRAAVEALKGRELKGMKLSVKALKPGDEFHDHIFSMNPHANRGQSSSLRTTRFRGDGSYRGSGAIRRGGRRGS